MDSRPSVGHDAPVQTQGRVTRRRWFPSMLVTSTVLFAACASTGSSDHSSGARVADTQTSATTPTSVGSVVSLAPTPSAPMVNLSDGCGTVLPSTSYPRDGLQTVMTVPPPIPGPLTYTLDVRPGAVCPGATIEITVHAHNSSDHDAQAGGAVLLGPIPHIALGEFGVFNVAAGSDGVHQLNVTMPLLPPGQYLIFLLGAGFTGATITVKDPTGI